MSDGNGWKYFGVFSIVVFVTLLILLVARCSSKTKTCDSYSASRNEQVQTFGDPLLVPNVMMNSNTQMQSQKQPLVQLDDPMQPQAAAVCATANPVVLPKSAEGMFLDQPKETVRVVPTGANPLKNIPDQMNFKPYGTSAKLNDAFSTTPFKLRYPDPFHPESLVMTGKENQMSGGQMLPDRCENMLTTDDLMPASWRDSQGQMIGCDNTCDNDAEAEWAEFAPTKTAFYGYLANQGNARFSINTRDPLPSKIGLTDPLRPPPPFPIGANVLPFGDSEYRQDLIYQAAGTYPKSTDC